MSARKPRSGAAPGPRAYHALAELPEDEFFEHLALGVSLTGSHVESLSRAIGNLLSADHHAPARILEAIAKEELGKMLILIDVARIDEHNIEQRRKQLERAGNHLAKALYFEAADGSPGDIREVIEHIARLRDNLYLDGPNDFDWMFRNRLISDREDAMYVDLQQSDDGLYWNDPNRPGLLSGGWGLPSIFELPGSLLAAGFGSVEGLRVIHGLWKGFRISMPARTAHDRGTRWAEIQALNDETLSALWTVIDGYCLTARQQSIIVNQWTFPLYELDLKMRKVDPDQLRRSQRLLKRVLLSRESGLDDLFEAMWSGTGADQLMTLDEFRSELMLEDLQGDEP